MARESSGPGSPATGRLKKEAGGLLKALGGNALSSVEGKVKGTAGRLTEYVEGGGGPGIMAAVTGAKGLAEGKSPLRSMFGAGSAGVKEKVKGMFGKGGKGGGGRKIKLTNIVESVDVGAPVRLAYNQWTQWSDFPKFMKKVENVDQPKEEQTRPTGRRRCSGHTAPGRPPSGNRCPTTRSSGARKARRGTSTVP